MKFEQITGDPGYALGTYAMTGAYGPVSLNEAKNAISWFVEQGGAIVDTADLYGNGASESLIGSALGDRRKDITLCSKFGFVFGANMNARGLDARPERVESACDASLARLKTDFIDVYYLHRIDPAVPIEDTVGAMARLVEKGKIGSLGLCEVSEPLIDRALAVHPIACVQSEYSLWSRDVEQDGLLDYLKEKGIAMLGYSPLGRGFLGGGIRTPDDFPEGDQRRDLPRFQGENFYKNLELVDKLKSLASRLNTNAAQLAIAWSKRHQQVIPVVGATDSEQVLEAFSATRLKVPAEIWVELEEIFPFDVAAGKRYPKAALDRLANANNLQKGKK